MEPGRLIAEEWGSLSGQFTAEEADFMSQLIGGCSNNNSNHNYLSVIEKQHCLTNSNSYFTPNSNSICFSQGSSSSSSNDSGGDIFSTTNIDTSSMVFCLGLGDYDDKICPHSFPWDENFSQMLNNESIDEEGSGLVAPVKLGLADNNFMVSQPSEEDRSQSREIPAKRFRSSTEDSRNMRKNQKSTCMSNKEEGFQWHGFIKSFPQVDSNASVELNGGTCSSLSPKDTEAPNLCRKSRATSDPPATDAQSVYARRRRERINERLKILQNLVPIGTKVDISTMLEEAVQYVKFLQHQIKLLSSDELWMYAPIAAYNGINIGLDLCISPAKRNINI